MRFFAVRHNQNGIDAEARGESADAIKLYEKAIRSDPAWSVPWYNLGLLYKRQRNWPESRRCNARALELDPKDEAAWWNLGIAATALGDWSEARRAWTTYGVAIPEGEGPIVAKFGLTPIRINVDGDGEVIWANRIDPARAYIASIPLPGSDHRHGDLLLHDGAPNGYRMYRGREVPVFDEIEILERSKLETFEAFVEVETVDDLVALEQTFEAEGCAAEDWATVHLICRECSEGRPHLHGEADPPRVAGEHHIGIAAPTLDVARALLETWSASGPTRKTKTPPEGGVSCGTDVDA